MLCGRQDDACVWSGPRAEHVHITKCRQLLWAVYVRRYTANKRWHWSTLVEQRTGTKEWLRLLVLRPQTLLNWSRYLMATPCVTSCRPITWFLMRTTVLRRPGQLSRLSDSLPFRRPGIFRAHPDPFRPLHNDYRGFPGGKAAEARYWPPTPVYRRGCECVTAIPSPHPVLCADMSRNDLLTLVSITERDQKIICF